MRVGGRRELLGFKKSKRSGCTALNTKLPAAVFGSRPGFLLVVKKDFHSPQQYSWGILA